MKHQWLQRRLGATQVIVIFGGWAIDPKVLAHLTTVADVIYVSDYRDLDHTLPELQLYDTRILVAWSFGVASYCCWQQGRSDPFDCKIAINGSMTPVHRKTGIPPVIMQKTIDTLSAKSFQIFLTRSFGHEQPHQSIDIAARKAELIAVHTRDYSDIAQHWDKVWISRDDQIFPFANMQRTWQGTLNILEGPHVPFAAWSSWDQALS